MIKVRVALKEIKMKAGGVYVRKGQLRIKEIGSVEIELIIKHSFPNCKSQWDSMIESTPPGPPDPDNATVAFISVFKVVSSSIISGTGRYSSSVAAARCFD